MKNNNKSCITSRGGEKSNIRKKIHIRVNVNKHVTERVQFSLHIQFKNSLGLLNPSNIKDMFTRSPVHLPRASVPAAVWQRPTNHHHVQPGTPELADLPSDLSPNKEPVRVLPCQNIHREFISIC